MGDGLVGDGAGGEEGGVEGVGGGGGSVPGGGYPALDLGALLGHFLDEAQVAAGGVHHDRRRSAGISNFSFGCARDPVLVPNEEEDDRAFSGPALGLSGPALSSDMGVGRPFLVWCGVQKGKYHPLKKKKSTREIIKRPFFFDMITEARTVIKTRLTCFLLSSIHYY